jgi:hypothetical protein
MNYEIVSTICLALICIIAMYAIGECVRGFFKKPEKMSSPRPYSFVRFKFENVAEEDKSYYTHFQLEKNQILLFISEIANMPGHCIVTKLTSNKDESDSVRTYTGYHTSDFVELTDEEV